jgi:hypothetical protein
MKAKEILVLEKILEILDNISKCDSLEEREVDNQKCAEFIYRVIVEMNMPAGSIEARVVYLRERFKERHSFLSTRQNDIVWRHQEGDKSSEAAKFLKLDRKVVYYEKNRAKTKLLDRGLWLQ